MRGAAVCFTAAGSGFVILLLSIPVVHGQNGWEVNCSPDQVCALKGSTVDISCSYMYPSTVNRVDHKFWYTKVTNDIYADLRSDPEYSGRVEYNCYDKTCTLTIRDLRESDSAQYTFRFITDGATGRYSSSPVKLSVTGLQVHVRRKESNRAQLECQSSCGLSGSLSYIWYKNGVKTTTQGLYDIDFSNTNSYSCAVEGNESSRSPPVLVKSSWGVTYTSTQICALTGSTVHMSCSFTYPSTVKRVTDAFWHTREDYNRLNDNPQYSGRVEYSHNNNTALKISNLIKSDSAVYMFRFITDRASGRYSGPPGVMLSVKDPQLEVHVRRSTVNLYLNWTELTCHNKCQLSEQPSYIWYNKGRKVGDKEYFHVQSVNPDDRYSCAVSGFASLSSPSVYAPQLPSVSVSPSGEIVEGSSVTLTCSSDANPAANYTWFKRDNNTDFKLVSGDQQLVFSSIQSSDSGEYYCTAENELGGTTSEHIFIDVKYPPRLPSVSVSPSGEIVEGRSVNLTCSSDANPAATYTWYKENKTLIQEQKDVYHFTSISSEDRGNYHCKSENQYGQNNSASFFLDVQYAPRLPSVSVSPSGEIMEGSSVTLTCSSDANPAANYTWYKENKTLIQGPEGTFQFSSISSEDRRNYSCKSENQYGQNSTFFFLDVHYPPRLPSVSVSPSGEIVEGSSVTLTCSSDANPAATYTWYKEDEDSLKASGQMFTITDFRAEDSGNYYCKVENKWGFHNSTLHLTLVAVFLEVWKLAIIGAASAVFMAIMLLFIVIFLLRGKKREQSSKPGDQPVNREQSQSEEQDDIHYASIKFSKTKTDPIYSNIRPHVPQEPEKEEEDAVEYSVVKFSSSSTAPRTRDPEIEEDPAALYSVVNKTVESKRNP